MADFLGNISPVDASFSIEMYSDGKWKLVNKIEDQSRRYKVNKKFPFKTQVPYLNRIMIILFMTERCNLGCSYCKFGSFVGKGAREAIDLIAIEESISKFACKG